MDIRIFNMTSRGKPTKIFYIHEEGLEPTDKENVSRKSLLKDGWKSIFEYKWERENGLPAAVEVGGTMYVFSHGMYQHRYNGPSDGSIWMIHGNNIRPTEYFEWLEESGIDINNISENDEFLITVKWNGDGK